MSQRGESSPLREEGRLEGESGGIHEGMFCSPEKGGDAVRDPREAGVLLGGDARLGFQGCHKT